MPEEYHKPECQMVGQDGNDFAIIGRVSKALKHDEQPARAKHWQERAKKCQSYDELLQLIYDYVEVY